MADDLEEPLSPSDARRLIRHILDEGVVELRQHALQEMAEDEQGEISTVDTVNVMRGGVVQPGELERGTYRYRVTTPRMTVVVAFRSPEHLIVVTAWRNKP